MFVIACLLVDYELISLNAMEERVLPPDIRIKIVFAQANAVDQDEELLEEDVSLHHTEVHSKHNNSARARPLEAKPYLLFCVHVSCTR